MKKVLVNYLGRMNSGPIIAIEVAKGLAESGYEVYALLSSSISNKTEWDVLTNIKKIVYIDTYSSKIEFCISTVKFLLFERKKIRNYFKNIEFDYIFNPMHHLWSPYIINLFNGKNITICHDPIPHEGENKLERLMTNKLMFNSKYIVVLTKSFIPIVERNFHIVRENIFYMPHGRMTCYKQNIKYSKKSDGSTTFLFFGRIEKYKGIEILLRAFITLQKEYENVKLIIAGKGDLKEYESLIKNIKNITIINDYIDDDNVGELFQNNTIVVLPYISATQSGVIPIAYEFGNAVIASDTGGLKEQLDDGKLGFFFEKGNVQELYKVMKKLHENKNSVNTEMVRMLDMRKKLEWSLLIKELMDSIERIDHA